MSTQRTAIPISRQPRALTGSSVVERTLRAMPGVVNAYVNPATDTAYIEYDPARCTPAELARILEDAGVKTGVPQVV